MLPVVVSFGASLVAVSLSDGEGTGQYSSFLAGFMPGRATTRFRNQIGVSPKTAAGGVRFERAMADIGGRSSAEVADEHGYADQSHLTREVVRCSGEPPRAPLAARRPTAYTALGAETR